MSDSNGNGSKYRWLAVPLITIFFALAAVTAGYATTKAEVNSLSERVIKQEIVVEDQAKEIKEVQIENAGKSQVLVGIQQSLIRIEGQQTIIQSDIKELKDRPHGAHP